MQRTPKKLQKQLKTHLSLSLFLCLYCFSLLISIHLSFNYAVRQFASRLLLNSFWLCCRKPTAHWMYQVKADKKDVFGDDAIESQQLPFPISIYHQTWTFSLVRRSPLGSKLRLCLFRSTPKFRALIPRNTIAKCNYHLTCASLFSWSKTTFQLYHHYCVPKNGSNVTKQQTTVNPLPPKLAFN